jgi:hypothetical protein
MEKKDVRYRDTLAYWNYMSFRSAELWEKEEKVEEKKVEEEKTEEKKEKVETKKDK